MTSAVCSNAELCRRCASHTPQRWFNARHIPSPMENRRVQSATLATWEPTAFVKIATHAPMTSIVLTAEQRKQIERRRKKTLDRRVYQRLTAVLAVAAGHPPEEVANLLGVDLTQQAQWLLVFLNEGLEALCILADEEPHPTND